MSSTACGGSDKPPSETPSSQTPNSATSAQTSYTLGAPRDKHYSADVEAQRGWVRVIVREEAKCDLIPIRTVVENGVERRVAGDPTSSKPCDEGYARNVIISLEVDGNTYRLGVPNAFGELQTQLSDRMLRDLYGDATSETPIAKVMLRDRQGRSHQIGRIELAQLAEADQRLNELLAEFKTLLDRPQSELTGAELARAYELYEQLSAFDSDNPRVGALQALFIDRLYQRKSDEAADRFKNNLQALNAAKDLLSNNRTVIIVPSFVSSAVQAGTLDPRTVAWARGEVALALRRQQDLCGDGRSSFTWSLTQLSPPKSRLAFHILRAAYDDPYQDQIRALCSRITM